MLREAFGVVVVRPVLGVEVVGLAGAGVDIFGVYVFEGVGFEVGVLEDDDGVVFTCEVPEVIDAGVGAVGVEETGVDTTDGMLAGAATGSTGATEEGSTGGTDDGSTGTTAAGSIGGTAAGSTGIGSIGTVEVSTGTVMGSTGGSKAGSTGNVAGSISGRAFGSKGGTATGSAGVTVLLSAVCVTTGGCTTTGGVVVVLVVMVGFWLLVVGLMSVDVVAGLGVDVASVMIGLVKVSVDGRIGHNTTRLPGPVDATRLVSQIPWKQEYLWAFAVEV